MYGMYPESWQGKQELNQSVTHRADEAELRRWEAEGADTTEPSDYVNARMVATADRTIYEAAREKELDKAFGRVSVRSMYVD